MEQRVRPAALSPTFCPTQPRQGALHASLSLWSLETVVQVGWQQEVRVKMAIRTPLKKTTGDVRVLL